MESVITQLTRAQAQVQGLMAQLDIPGKQTRLSALEAEAADPNLWSNPEAAQSKMRDLARLKDEVERWQRLAGRIQDALELAELGDDDMLAELNKEATTIGKQTARLELEAVFSGPYDREDAILAIHAGAGGTDSQDWAEMLERMYLRWAENNNYKTEVLERSEGEEAGVKSVTISVRGNLAYGYLRSEQGVHRLVRLSPFDAANRRHTSFAKVELWPDLQQDVDIDLNENDLRIDTYRAGGAGGQHVQKNETAIRITHIPTGIVVQCQNQRSLAQNKERALQILKARLFELERRKHEEELARIKGDNVDAGFGNQIRSYVLHPYQLVKDHRINVEVGNTSGVLDGDLNVFMEAYLRAQLEKLHA